MKSVNLFSAENGEGRIDVARALESTATAMYVYDLAPGQSSSPYHYEYEEEWAPRAPAVSIYPDSNKIGIWPGDPDNELIFTREAAVPWSHGEEGWEKAS